METNIAPNIREKWNLVGEVCHQLKESASPLVHEKVVNLDVLIELLVTQSNLNSQQNERHFITNPEEMKAFVGINYVMTVNQLPNIPMYWDCDHFIGISGIQNIFTRGKYQEILQNVHFADNSKHDQTDKDYKIRPIIDHLNKSFQESYSNEPKQSIDEYMTKFKGCSSMRQYLKMKPIKWGFKWWFEVRAQIIFCMNLIYI